MLQVLFFVRASLAAVYKPWRCLFDRLFSVLRRIRTISAMKTYRRFPIKDDLVPQHSVQGGPNVPMPLLSSEPTVDYASFLM